MKHVYEITHDEEAAKKIAKQSKNLYNSKSEKADSVFRHRVYTIVDKVLSSHDITTKAFYGDVFPNAELLRFKAVIKKLGNYKEVLSELNEELLLEFRLKQLTYLDEDETMILIWM